MAQHYGVNYAAARPPTSAPIIGGDAGGKRATFYDEFVTVAGMLANDTIDFGPPSGAVKKGDRVMGATIAFGALGAGVLLSLGDDELPARYIGNANAAAAGIAGMNVAAGFGWRADRDRIMRLRITGAAPAVGQRIAATWKVLRS